LKIWEPDNKKQAQIYNDRTHRYLHAIGDPRSGKSEAFFRKCWREICLTPGCDGLITRDTGTSITGITYPQFYNKIVDKRFILDEKIKPYPWLKFKNGSTLSFQPFEEIDISKAGGGEYTFVLIEESSRSSRPQWDYFDTRLSQTIGHAISPSGEEYENPITHVWLGSTGNPKGRGWSFKLYSIEHPLSYLHADPEFIAWKFYLRDNKHLSKKYIDSMESKPQHIKDKILGANEDPVSGLVFLEFSKELHVCKPPLGWIPKPFWRILGGMDHGFKSPTVFLWMAVTDDNFLIVFNEYRQSHKIISENSKEIYEEQERLFKKGVQWIQNCAIDPSTQQVDGKSGSTKSTFQLYLDAGMNRMSLYPAPKQWVRDRVERIRILLQCDPRKKYHPITGEYREDGWPTLIFTDNCDGGNVLEGYKQDGGTISEMEEWEIRETNNSKKNAQEAPEEKNDHGPDALAYALTLYFGDASPENPKTVRERELDPLERRKKKIQERLEKAVSPVRANFGLTQGVEL
jgi:hypothetical protein